MPAKAASLGGYLNKQTKAGFFVCVWPFAQVNNRKAFVLVRHLMQQNQAFCLASVATGEEKGGVFNVRGNPSKKSSLYLRSFQPHAVAVRARLELR